LLWAAAMMGAAGLVAAAINLSYEQYIVGPEDRAVRRGWQHVVPGMSEHEVIGLLGEPDDRTEVFYLGQREGYEDAYSRAANSRSTYYLMWKREIDAVYAVGFDNEGAVAIKEVGGT